MSPLDKPTDPRFTDAANGVRFVNAHGGDVRYVAEDKQWLVWDSSRWLRDVLGESMELAKHTAHLIYEEAKTSTSFDQACSHTEAAEWATASLSTGKLNGMLKMASTERQVAISAEVLDRDPWLLNCTNGTVDLRSGELREAAQEDLITKTTGIAFDSTAKCPKWDAFLRWAMCDRIELVDYLHRIIGMTLSGDVSERLVFFFHGTGKNGKDVTLKVMQGIFGDYGQRMESKTLEAASYAKGGGGPSDDIASLKGARLVYTSELEDGTKLATALLKDMTGDQKLRARHLYKSSFMFMPEFTPFIAANHKPSVPSDDQAVWDRLRLIPYDARISIQDRDRHLAEKLLAEEAPGILARAVRECVVWQRDGLVTPSVVVEATEDYRDEMDYFGEFLQHITESEYAVVMTPSALRENFNGWAKDNTDSVKLSQRQFKAHMEARGWKQEKTEDGTSRQWIAPSKKVIRVNWGEQARIAAAHEPTADEIAAAEAENAAIAIEEQRQADEGGYPSVEAMYEHERLQREAVE
jgi:putative DNA primase/helicase